MSMEKSSWEKAVEFHGHTCPGLAIGFRAAEAVLQVLGLNRDINEQLVAVAENDSCSVDAIQSVLSCTVGKGNLILANYGKQVFTVGERKTGKAVRAALKFDFMQKRAASREERMQQILEANIEELFDVKVIDMEFPAKAMVFQTVQCTSCGEGVMEFMARLKEGKVVCPVCAGEYTRGW